MFGHWEEYHTGVLMYGNTWFGVLEANYSLAFAQFLTAAMGAGVWDTQVVTLPEQIPLPDALPRTWSECGRDCWALSSDGTVHVCRVARAVEPRRVSCALPSGHYECRSQAWGCMALTPPKHMLLFGATQVPSWQPHTRTCCRHRQAAHTQSCQRRECCRGGCLSRILRSVVCSAGL